MRISRLSLTLLLLVNFSLPAMADVVQINLTGHVLDYISGNPAMGVDTYGTFGAPGGRINGDAYTAAVVYDTALAPADAAPSNPNYGSYSRDCDPCTTSANGPPFLSIAVTINGHTETITGADHLETALVSSSGSQDTISFEAANHTSVSGTGIPFDESYADFTFNSMFGQLLTNSDALPASVNLGALLNPGSDTKIGDLSLLRGVYGNPNTESASVFAYLGLDSVTRWSSPAVVPIVPADWLLGSALMSLVGISRRKRRQYLPDKTE